jgi:O-acetyl-ADP-ribose deacetylase (regulator of RNase III)
MRAQFGQAAIELAQGDVTQQRVDAIVNAANRRLAGGGGVDGAIHRAGGPAILAETQRRFPHGCPTGSAVATAAGNLPARFVIHAVGPVYSGGRANEGELLAGAYQTSLQLAAQLGCESIALPAISTGAYGYPLAEAARIALGAAVDHARTHHAPQIIRFVLFGSDALAEFQAALSELTKES